MIVSICGYGGITMAADSGASRHIAMSDIRLLLAINKENVENIQDKNLEFCFTDNCEKIHLMQNNIAVSEGGQWLITGKQGEKASIRPYLDHFYLTKHFDTPIEPSSGYDGKYKVLLNGTQIAAGDLDSTVSINISIPYEVNRIEIWGWTSVSPGRPVYGYATALKAVELRVNEAPGFLAFMGM
jgi:hypothetical protein